MGFPPAVTFVTATNFGRSTSLGDVQREKKLAQEPEGGGPGG
jgi:hypothetical protein